MDLRLTLKSVANYRDMGNWWRSILGKGTAGGDLSTSAKVRCRHMMAGICCCLLTIVVLEASGSGAPVAAADDSVLRKLEDMRVRIEDLSARLEKEEADRLAADQKLMTLIAKLNVRFVHYRVDGAGNLTTGEGADFTAANARSSLVIKKSENLFCAISQTRSSVRGDNASYSYHCEVARNGQNLWAVTAKDMSSCRVACVGVEISRDQ